MCSDGEDDDEASSEEEQEEVVAWDGTVTRKPKATSSKRPTSARTRVRCSRSLLTATLAPSICIHTFAAFVPNQA